MVSQLMAWDFSLEAVTIKAMQRIRTRTICSVISVVLLIFSKLSAAENLPESALPHDHNLEHALRSAVESLGLASTLQEKHLAVSLVDVTDPAKPHYAGLNDRHMMYAASLPKIAVLVAGFERIHAGLMDYTPEVKEMFIRMTRFSSNPDASRAIHQIGFQYIADVLTSSKYHFYDPAENGGLWVGKAYGGPQDYWRRDPLHHISHGATTFEVSRLFVMLEQRRLVTPEYSDQMKEILSRPAIHHKFVKGLDRLPGHIVYRKSGTWSIWHSDAALVEHGGKKYIAVALMEDSHGGQILPELIVKLDRLICGEHP